MLSEVRSEIVYTSKALVDRLLAMNTHNRTIRQMTVDRLEKDIREGRWMLNNQGVGISRDGVTLDGQHRLLAIKQAGYPPVPLLLVWGLDPRAIATIDVGTRRQNHDTIKLLLDRDAGSRFVSACSCISNHRWNGSSWRVADYVDRIRSIDLAGVVSEYMEAEGILSRACTNQRFFRSGTRAALLVFARTHPEIAHDFVKDVELGEVLDRTMPAYWLREHCLRGRHANGGSQSQLMDWAVAVRCINDFVMGRQTRMWKVNMAQDWCLQIKERMPNVDTH